MSDHHWDIRREGRSWMRAEALARLELLPIKLEMLRGKLCLDEAQRLVLLAALLENVGIDTAIQLADLDLWMKAIAARVAEATKLGAFAGPARKLLEVASTVMLASGDDLPRPELPEARRTWDYRVLAFSSAQGEKWHSIHEVHYDDGRPIAYNERPTVVLRDSEEGIAGALRCIERMKEALLKPKLNATDFGEK